MLSTIKMSWVHLFGCDHRRRWKKRIWTHLCKMQRKKKHFLCVFGLGHHSFGTISILHATQTHKSSFVKLLHSDFTKKKMKKKNERMKCFSLKWFSVVVVAKTIRFHSRTKWWPLKWQSQSKQRHPLKKCSSRQTRRCCVCCAFRTIKKISVDTFLK